MTPLRRPTALALVVMLLWLAGCTGPAQTPVAARPTLTSAHTAAPAVPTNTAAGLAPAPSATHTMAPKPTASATLMAPKPATASPVTVRPSATLGEAAPLTATPARTRSATPSATPPAPAEWQLSHLLVGPGQPGRLYAHQVLRSADSQRLAERLLVSDDSGQTWRAFPAGLPTGALVNDLSMDYAQQDALYAATDNGLYALVSGSWALLNPDITRAISVAYGDPQVMWSLQRGASDAPYGSLVDYVVESTDGGRTWSAAEFGTYGSLLGVAINPSRPDEVYALSAYKTWWFEFYRYRSGTWELLPSPVRDTDGHPAALMAPMFGGWTIDGATGAIYVAYSREQLSDPSAMCCWAQEIWRTTNTASDDVNEIGWEPVYDFGAYGAVSLASSGWSAQGLALYALHADIEPAQRCDCGGGRTAPRPAFTLFVSPDSGQTWQALPDAEVAER